MFLEKVHSPGLAHISYILGDSGRAAVIDPRRDCQVYAEIARDENCRITHIFETHRNEDYVVGSTELARRTGAEIFHGEALPFDYGTPVSEGDIFELGAARLSVLNTPGHTDESISLILADTGFSDDPIAVFTGDVLFVGDVGRTDFFPDRADEVAGLLFDSIFDKLLPLGDHVIVHPAHGAGSVCGGKLASREFTTIGYERQNNPILQMTDRGEFIDYKTSEHHYMPPYFAQMEKHNLQGPPVLGRLPQPMAYTAHEFADQTDSGMFVLDVRSPEAFGGAHIPDSQSIPMDMLPLAAGWLLPYDAPIGLVVESRDQVQEAVRHLIRQGYDNIPCYLEDGMHQWETGGREFEGMPQIYIGEIVRRITSEVPFTLLDVRGKSAYDSGHLPGAVNIYFGELADRLDEVPDDRPITTFCGTGHRAIIAASVLRRNGFQQVENCLGSMAACKASPCPLLKTEQ